MTQSDEKLKTHSTRARDANEVLFERVERLEKTLAQFIEWTDGLGLQGGDKTLLLNMLAAAPEHGETE